MGITLPEDFQHIFLTPSRPRPETPLDTISLESLAERRIWVAWQLQPNKDGKPTKVPYNPTGHGKAEANDSSTWGTKEQADARFASLLIDPALIDQSVKASIRRHK